MCGIWGISYGPGGPEAEMWTPAELAQLMFPAIIHRGPHSWGYMTCPTDESSIDTFKMVGKCNTKQALAAMDDVPSDIKWLVGHVRYATHGSPENLANDHPIKHGSILGVHNGVLRDWRKIIEETGREDESAEVDSEAIFAAVNKWGMKRGLARVNGDIVTVLSSTDNPGTLRIARSFGRPLVYAFTPAGSMVFASECCVLDATGMDFSTPIDFNAKYRMLTVRGGKITRREQYRSQSWTKFDGGVRGITDFYETSRAESTSTRRHGGKPDSLAPPPREWPPAHVRMQNRGATVNGTPVSNNAVVPARDVQPATPLGAVNIGGGWWQLPSGNIVSADEYIEWSVEQHRNPGQSTYNH